MGLFRSRHKHSKTSPKFADITDAGLTALRSRLGMIDDADSDSRPQNPAPLAVHSTDTRARTVLYAPDLDGHAEAGEVVWLWLPVDGPDNPPKERTVLVVGRAHRHNLLGLLISNNDQHDTDPNWLPIGTGQWEPTGEPTWLRLDKILEVPETAARRKGALFPERRFERVANALRRTYGWG